MNYTPNELQNLVFKKSLLGYHQNQVLDVLLKVVEDYADYIRENVKNKGRIEEMHEKIQYYRSIEQMLQNSLIVAQKASDEVVTNAKAQAENIVAEAQLRAREILDEANRTIANTVYEKEQIIRETLAYRARIESLLAAQHNLLASWDHDEPQIERPAMK